MNDLEEENKRFDEYLANKESNKGKGDQIKNVKILEEIDNTPFYDSNWWIEVITKNDEVKKMHFTYYACSKERLLEHLNKCETIGDIRCLDKAGCIVND